MCVVMICPDSWSLRWIRVLVHRAGAIDLSTRNLACMSHSCTLSTRLSMPILSTVMVLTCSRVCVCVYRLLSSSDCSRKKTHLDQMSVSSSGSSGSEMDDFSFPLRPKSQVTMITRSTSNLLIGQIQDRQTCVSHISSWMCLHVSAVQYTNHATRDVYRHDGITLGNK